MTNEVTENERTSSSDQPEAITEHNATLGRRALMLGAVGGAGVAVGLVAGADPAAAANNPVPSTRTMRLARQPR